MIDLTSEVLIPLADAAKLIPPGRNGKRTHLSTILRWILTGARGPDGARIRLEGVRLGARWMTTHGAIARFSEALTPLLGDSDPSPTPRAPARRRRTSERAAAELERLGV